MWIKGTRFRPVCREALGNVYRELKIAIKPTPKPKKWLFLVGCYNSGTTLLADLIGRHSKMSVLPTEGHFITDQFPKDYEMGIPRMWVDREDIFCLKPDDTGPDVIRIKKEWGMRLDLAKPVLVEKSPPNTARMLWLAKHFENAHFVGIVRNPYAVSEGISRKGNPQSLSTGWPIAKSAWQWARSNELMLEYAKQVDKFMLIKYEDLVSRPQSILDDIANFVELEAFPALANGQTFEVHERRQTLADLNHLSMEKLAPQDFAIINAIAGSMIQRMGYVPHLTK